jgi:hypothetical protein
VSETEHASQNELQRRVLSDLVARGVEMLDLLLALKQIGGGDHYPAMNGRGLLYHGRDHLSVHGRERWRGFFSGQVRLRCRSGRMDWMTAGPGVKRGPRRVWSWVRMGWGLATRSG